jgi:hypothetical protein
MCTKYTMLVVCRLREPEMLDTTCGGNLEDSFDFQWATEKMLAEEKAWHEAFEKFAASQDVPQTNGKWVAA